LMNTSRLLASSLTALDTQRDWSLMSWKS